MIVATDDYGIRRTADAILPLVRAGKVDRVAAMVRYVSVDDAKKLVATDVSIDIHLDLIEIIKSGEKMYDGALKRAVGFLVRFLAGTATPERAREEWKKQIELFREKFGRLPDGLNSHEHVHYFPGFFTVVLDLAEEYHIPYIRFGSHGISSERKVPLVGRILRFLRWWNYPVYVRTPVPTSEYNTSFDWLRRPRYFLSHLPEGKTEIAFHPERDEERQWMEKNL